MWSQELHVAGIDSVNTLGQFDLNAVSPEYFRTMGTRILEGRGIGPQDVAAAPRAMVVSQAMARKLWPGEDALGHCVRVGADTTPCTYVVGVAENIKNDQLGNDPGLFYYLSGAQFHPDQGGLFLRVRGDAGAMTETIRKALQQLMPGVSYVTVRPMKDIIAEQTQPWRLGATMFVIFGLLALALAAIGRWVEPLLFEESAHDPAVIVLVAAVLLAVAALASFLPARRAARVDPIRALKTE